MGVQNLLMALLQIDAPGTCAGLHVNLDAVEGLIPIQQLSIGPRYFFFSHLSASNQKFSNALRLVHFVVPILSYSGPNSLHVIDGAPSASHARVTLTVPNIYLKRYTLSAIMFAMNQLFFVLAMAAKKISDSRIRNTRTNYRHEKFVDRRHENVCGSPS